MRKNVTTHLIFISLELIVAPAVALAMGLGVTMSETTSPLMTALRAGLVMFFLTFAGLLGVFGYQHFKRVGQPGFWVAAFRGIFAGTFMLILFVVDNSASFWGPYYGIMYMPVLCAVAGFNSILAVRGK
jgi:hypothetical protein